MSDVGKSSLSSLKIKTIILIYKSPDMDVISFCEEMASYCMINLWSNNQHSPINNRPVPLNDGVKHQHEKCMPNP